jgi:low affinity Fe/Cu permease
MDTAKPCADGLRERFRRLSCRAAECVGSYWAFGLSLALIAVWGATGPIFHFSDTWQLVINTGTTIVTFLMVFVIQNTQNRDAKAIHLKLDELIRSTSRARNSLVNLENLTDDEIAQLQEEFAQVQKRAQSRKAQNEEAKKDPAEPAPRNGKSNGKPVSERIDLPGVSGRL